ncbi:GTP-binding protein 10 isoform X2 [Rhodnius prolixus]|uniref:Putative gtp-binding protein odn superfamily n=1 Tax=Rhodnius prolixus TaxID=13249 RepID=R4G7U3_RHOPR
MGGIRRKIPKFIDSLRLYLKAGAGGMGYPKYGGVGGAGGDIYIVAKEGSTLKEIKNKFPEKRIAAGNGSNAHQRCIVGLKGRDVTIQAPLGIVLYDQVGNKVGELNQEGDRYRVVAGGLGGCPDTGFSGLKGESQLMTLDLKLIADVGLVGFPNAGKSTLISKLSNAKPKIASYPFTTVQPQLGIIKYSDDRSISIADLPGLIEGAHINVGMGHKFLKHIERTKLLLVVVDVGGFRLSTKYSSRSCLETIILLNKELELYKQELLNYPAILVVNKMDQNGSQSVYEEICETVKNLEGVFPEVPETIRPAQPFEFQRVVGISAKNGDAKEINLVKEHIREVLDQNMIENNDQDLALVKYFNTVLKEKGPKIV